MSAKAPYISTLPGDSWRGIILVARVCKFTSAFVCNSVCSHVCLLAILRGKGIIGLILSS